MSAATPWQPRGDEDEQLAAAEPVGELAEDERGEDHEHHVDEREHDEVVFGVLVLQLEHQEVEQQARAERVADRDEHPAEQGPAEVGVLARADPEAAEDALGRDAHALGRRRAAGRRRKRNGTASTTRITASRMYPSEASVTSSVTSTRPTMMPTACGADIQPETKPRWFTGTWSEIVAVSAAVMMQKPTDAATHVAPIAQISVCWPERDEREARRRRRRSRSTGDGGRTARSCGRRARPSAGRR